MRIGGRQATGAEIRHSRWPSWCAVLFEKSDTEGRCVWSGQRSARARGLITKPMTRQVMVHIQFFMYQGYERRKNCTLASRGLEETAHASRGLEEPFFQFTTSQGAFRSFLVEKKNMRTFSPATHISTLSHDKHLAIHPI